MRETEQSQHFLQYAQKLGMLKEMKLLAQATTMQLNTRDKHDFTLELSSAPMGAHLMCISLEDTMHAQEFRR